MNILVIWFAPIIFIRKIYINTLIFDLVFFLPVSGRGWRLGLPRGHRPHRCHPGGDGDARPRPALAACGGRRPLGGVGCRHPPPPGLLGGTEGSHSVRVRPSPVSMCIPEISFCVFVCERLSAHKERSSSDAMAGRWRWPRPSWTCCGWTRSCGASTCATTARC